MTRGFVTAGLAAALAAATLHALPAQTAAPLFELPAPTGPFAVATTQWRLTDSARKETYSSANAPREIEVLAWYPAAAPRHGALAPYLREGIAEARTFAKLVRGAESAFDGLESVRTHAEVDGRPASAPRRFPVLLFSPGLTGVASSHAALVEDLASHGYAVLEIVHPYEVAAAKLSDGRIATVLDESGAPSAGLREIFAEWASEDATMAAVARSTDTAERLRLLRGYLAGLHHTTIALHRWVDDTKLVLDKLSTVPADSAAGRLIARLDTTRLGVLGHSMGGVVAGQFCLEDRRCRAGLNLDGSPQSGDLIDKTMAQPFLMMYSARDRTGANDAIYARAARRYYRVDVRETRHLDFCDMTFWGGPLRERPVLGAIAPARVTEILRAVVRRYFDQELRGQRSALAVLSSYPEVAFTTATAGR
jgi:predicted dienelactone hydrolase